MTAICNFLQDAAGCHAHALGVSIDLLQSHHLTWVLVRMRLRLARHPGWQERLRIETWPSSQERLISQRDFRLRDEAGHTVGQCVTSWVLMDLHRWRPQRLTALPRPLPIPDLPRVLILEDDKVEAPAQFVHEGRFRVGHRDLDRNGHVNNVRYIEWALETVPPSVINTCGLEALSVDFVGEALHGEHILAGSQSCESHPPTFRHGIRSQSTENDLARVETRWQPLA